MKTTLRFLSYSLIAACLFTFIACTSGSGTTQNEEKPKDTVAMKTDSMFEHLLVDNKKDPACGMPVTAGISDTAHYKDHVLGFCSKECKETFKKDPETYIAAADIKK